MFWVSVVVMDVCMGGHTALQYVSKYLVDTIICFGLKGEGNNGETLCGLGSF